MLEVNWLTRLWCLIAFGPMTLGVAWGMAFEARVESVSIFRVMGAWAPLWLWGALWFILSLLHLFSGLCAIPRLYQIAVGLGVALSTGQLVATLWARAEEGSLLTTVGVSWPYFIWAVYVLVLWMMSSPLRAHFWTTVKGDE